MILFGFYAVLVFLIVKISKTRPGIGSYDRISEKQMSRLNAIHILNIVVMLVPSWIIRQSPTSFLIFPDKVSIAQALAFLLTFGFISVLPWKRNNRMPDEIVSSTREVYGYLTSRVIFLVAYEWFFRGLLLTTLCSLMGNSWGIIANVSLYAAIHFYKGRKEMIGCVPLGILLCVFTLWWHSVWPAIIFHLQIAIINEWPPLQHSISSQKQTAL
jgi:membrane protease YdiL (CAAX protease family)